MPRRLGYPHASRASRKLCIILRACDKPFRFAPAWPCRPGPGTPSNAAHPNDGPARNAPHAPADTLSPVSSARALLLSTLSSAALVLSSSLPALSAESLTIKFPASRDPEIRSAQELLVQTWGYVRELYVDPTFNHQDWKRRLQDALAATFRATSRDEALLQVEALLSSLGDPFTRVLLPGGASEAFAAMKRSQIVSTGLGVGRLRLQGAAAAAGSTAGRGGGTGAAEGPLQVVFVIEGSPAQAAGLRVGDEVVAVNGNPVAALRNDEGERTLQDLLRQDLEVTLKLRRPTGPVTGSDTAAAAARPSSAPSSSYYQLTGSFFDVVLRPAPVEFVPVQYAVLDKVAVSPVAGGRRGSGGGSGPSPPPLLTSSNLEEATAPSRVGYIRIVAFTEGVGSEVESAVRALQAAGCGSWLLDLRSNPGGVVGEGQSVAELLLPPGRVFARVTDRSGEEHTERLSDRARALVQGQPLAVLVDRYTASTSELLAGALHDDARAPLIGERTYGKGRTQQVVQLPGGATLLVSTDTYVTPAGRPVDGVGLRPDVECRPGPPPPPVSRPARAALAAAAAASDDDDATAGIGDGYSSSSSTVTATAAVALSGGGGSSMLRGEVERLARDACVRAAVGKLTRGSL